MADEVKAKAVSYFAQGDMEMTLTDEAFVWTIHWGDNVLKPEPAKPLTQWQRVRRKLAAPYWWAAAILDDIRWEGVYRIEGAWKVLTGKARWE